MKILWHSTAPYGPSSYSVLSARTTPDIVRDGHQLTISTWFGLQGQPLPMGVTRRDSNELLASIKILPSIDDNYGAASLKKLYAYTGAEALITVCDVWVFQPQHTGGLNFCPWFPVDHDPVPELVEKALGPALVPMCFSKWGTGLLNDIGLDACYIPCSAPTEVFSPGNKTEARQQFELPEGADFLISMVAANKSPEDRKGFNEALLGFAKFYESHPDAALYIHTDWGGAIDIEKFCLALGIEKQVLRPHPMAYALGELDMTYISQVYRASDVLLNPAKSEGFGLPLVEAQMCGCPVAASDYSTTDELLGAGWKIPTMPDWTAGQSSFRARCTIDGIADALEAAYRDRNNEALRAKAKRFAGRYDTYRVYKKYWRPALRRIEKLIEGGNNAKVGIRQASV